MSIETRVESDLRDEPISELLTDENRAYICIDEIVGRLIVAQYKVDSQAVRVHMLDDLTESFSDITPEWLDAHVNRGNLHTELLPWFSTKIPVHFDSGEPAQLTIRYLPDVALRLAWKYEV